MRIIFIKIWQRLLAKSPKIIEGVDNLGFAIDSMSPKLKFRLSTVYAAAILIMWWSIIWVGNPSRTATYLVLFPNLLSKYFSLFSPSFLWLLLFIRLIKKKKGERDLDYIQKRMGHTRRSFSHGMTLNSSYNMILNFNSPTSHPLITLKSSLDRNPTL